MLNIHDVFLSTVISYLPSPSQKKKKKILLFSTQLLFCTVIETWKVLAMRGFVPESTLYSSGEHGVSLEIQESWFWGRGYVIAALDLGSPQGGPDQGEGGDWEECNNTKGGTGGMRFPFLQFHQLICTPLQHQCPLLLRKF